MFEPCATVEGNLLLPELPEAAGRRTLFCWKLKVSYDTLRSWNRFSSTQGSIIVTSKRIIFPKNMFRYKVLYIS